MKMKSFSAPYLVWMVVFIVVPLLMVVYFAFSKDGGGLTIDHIAEVGQYANIFVRSIWLSVIATAVCLVLAYPVSYMLARMPKHKQGTWLMIVMLPMWMNFLLRTYAWMTLLGNNGIINHLLGLVGLGPYKLINTSGAVVLGMVYNYVPFMILPLYSVELAFLDDHQPLPDFGRVASVSFTHSARLYDKVRQFTIAAFRKEM